MAFDGHALGRPKIERLLLRIVPDENTALAALLAGSAHYAECFALRFEHTLVLRREWVPSGKGVSLICPSAINNSAVQFRTELQKSPLLLDLRVRQAMAHAIDRRAIHDGLYDGEGVITDTFVPPEAPYFADVQRAIVHYPYDPRRTEQLMVEAGLVRDSDGLFAARPGERFRPDFWTTASTENERSAAIVAETWRRAGIETQSFVVSVAATRDPEMRAAFPGLATVGIGAMEDSIKNFTSVEIGSAANRWRGNNRGGWVSPEVDRLVEAFHTTLDRAERDRHVIAIARVVSEQLPILTYHPNFRAKAHDSSLQGPDAGAPSALSQWNIHEWHWTQ